MHPYVASPKAVLIAGPRCSGKTHAGRLLAERYGFACISQDQVRLTIQAETGLGSDELFEPESRDLYKKEFMRRLRGIRYADLVVEGARLAQDFVLDAFLEALTIEYGEYVVVKPFFLLPPLALRHERFSARVREHIAELERERGRDEPDGQRLQQLAEYIVSSFDAFPQPPAHFQLATGPEQITDWLDANLTALHRGFPYRHAALIEAIARSESSFSPFYQTIDIAGERIVTGQTHSYLTWENIQKLGLDWKGKSVCELGCNTGYFLFKAANLGARCTGFDLNAGSVRAAKTIAGYTGADVEFHCQDISGGLDRDYDIVFALNVLHYMPDLPATVDAISRRAKSLVLEVGKGQLPEIIPATRANGLSLQKTVPSHRTQGVLGERVILHLSREQAGAGRRSPGPAVGMRAAAKPL